MTVWSETTTTEASRGSVAADTVAALTLTISSVGFAISFAVLIFGGLIGSGMSRAIGCFIVGNGVMAIVAARRSNIVPIATTMQDGPAILMAAVVADFVAREGASVSDVFVLLAVTVLTTSLVTGVLGRFGLGGVSRYLPTPVVAAFAGGTGWLMFKGGVDVMTTSNLGRADLNSLFGFGMAKFWLPGLIVGVVTWLVGRSQRLPAYTLGLIFIACLGGFYGVVTLTSSVSTVEAEGWLLGPFPRAGGPTLLSPSEFLTANWGGIARSAPGIAVVVGIACVTHLLHLTGIRAELDPRLEVNAELQTGAGANLAVALLGVIPGSQGYGFTMMLHRLGATRRAVPLASGGLVVAFGVVGARVVGYVPRLIVGALLVMLGVALLDEWIRGLRRMTSVAERLLSVATVGAVIPLGLVQGIGLGLVAAGLIFIVRCCRIDPVRSAGNGHQLRSGADRTPAEAERLTTDGHRLVAIQLHGSLFFGSCGALEDRVCQIAHGPDSVETMVLDFASVTDVDGSGSVAMVRLFQELRRKKIVVWVSALDPEVVASLLAIEPELAAYVRFVPSLTAALKHAEDQLLTSLPGRPVLIGSFGVVPAPEHRRWREPAEFSPMVRSSAVRSSVW
ncbi:MAG: SulP family inorganic anion transporter [Acidimicrobiales bacterium]